MWPRKPPSPNRARPLSTQAEAGILQHFPKSDPGNAEQDTGPWQAGAVPAPQPGKKHRGFPPPQLAGKPGQGHFPSRLCWEPAGVCTQGLAWPFLRGSGDVGALLSASSKRG